MRAPDLPEPTRAADEGVPEMEAAAVEAALSDAPVEAECGLRNRRSRCSAADEGVPEMEAAAVEAALSDAPIEAEARAPESTEPMRAAAAPLQAHWLLSLFTPAADDTVDWGRGSYTVLARGGRVDSPSGSGELKKQIQMVAEGSVLYAEWRFRAAPPPTWRRMDSRTRCFAPASRSPSGCPRCIDALSPHMPDPAAGR